MGKSGMREGWHGWFSWVGVGVGEVYKIVVLLGDLLVFQAVSYRPSEATAKKNWKVPVESGVLLVSVLLIQSAIKRGLCH